ncbi:hypothetical protein Tco_0772629 [Tanacetum coccineum]|uniref:GAG-pre-integrase domain-containing protein n=1 Tax=Tanacetum coccineum TaxID=301880 RepID=A0ABQ4ZMH6_9ASTR
MILENDGVTFNITKEKVKSLALKAKVTREQTSKDSDSQEGCYEDLDEEESEAFNLMARNFQNFFQKGNRFRRGNRFGNEDNKFRRVHDPRNNGYQELEFIFTCRLFTSYKEYDSGHVVFGSNLKGKVISGGNISLDSITIINLEHVGGLAFNLISIGHRINGLYTYKIGDDSKQQICLASIVDNSTLWHGKLGHANMCIDENFDESLPKPKSVPLVEVQNINELIVQDLHGSSSLEVNVSNEGYPKSVKEARGHPIEQVIGELNERTLRSKTKQA